MKYDMVSENTESTVVAEFEAGDYSSAQYQSEAAMEADFIKRLQRQAYEYLPIKCEADLIANLRTQIEKLNQMQFTDSVFQTAPRQPQRGHRGKNPHHSRRP